MSEARQIRVVVVDDHEPYRRAVTEIVGETAGFTVVGAADSGEGSLSLLAQVATDLVLMDVNLPGIDGLEVTRQLTRRPGPPVVVLLSSFEEGEIDYRDCGASGFITKAAFDPDRLAAEWERIGRTA